MTYPTDFAAALAYNLALSEIDKAEVMAGLVRRAERYDRAVMLLRSWCAGNGDVQYAGKENAEALLKLTNDFFEAEL